MVSKSSVAGYDDRFYESLADVYLHCDRWTKLRMDQVLKMVQPRKNDTILDLGCASGATAHFCSQSGAKVIGVDNTPLAISKAKELFSHADIQFLERDVSDLHGIVDGSFDKVVATDLVEHITQDVFEGMVKESYRVLKTGGSISIYTPNPVHIIEILKARSFILQQNPTHIDLKTMERIVDTLNKYNFSIGMAYYTASFLPVFKHIECMLKPLPLVGRYFRYRICVTGIK